jgi:hypothetical protein
VPDFQDTKDGWLKGYPLEGVRAEECTVRGALLPESLVVKNAPGDGGTTYVWGRDYDCDPDWGTVGRIIGGGISPKQSVWIDYSYTKQRLDSAILDSSGSVVLREGIPHNTMPEPPVLQTSEVRLVNIHLAGPMARLREENLFPILETAYPQQETSGGSIAEKLLPETTRKLASGERLRILAWGDSVTGYNRYQVSFTEWLRARFPSANIELLTEAWPAKSSVDYLAETPGSEHNFEEKVLAAKPDLIISEFVNDASLEEEESQILDRHVRLLAAFRGIGAEWIILTPHYVRPDWMGLASQRDIDDDPRLYVRALREFCRNNRVALADASRLYGRLWRQGIPFLTLMENGINHPNPAGHAIFAESLTVLFPPANSHPSTENQP